jgi:hypothetical protein
MEKERPPKINEVKIELPESCVEGKYSNFAIISHSPAEFVIDFARLMPGSTKAIVQTRVILTPIHAKTLLYTLKDNLEKFEKKFGEVTIPPPDEGIMPPFPPQSNLPN